MKLDDIKKKNVYTVPDRYFEQLPGRIQQRVSKKKSGFFYSFNWKLTAQIASPVLAVLLLIFYFGIGTQTSALSAEELLAEVATEDVIAYLETTDLSADEIIEELDLSMVDLDFTEDRPIIEDLEMNEQDLDLLFDEYGIESELL